MAFVDTVETNEIKKGWLQGTSSVLPVFAATIFLSAFLLFSVQPLFAKMVLPILGGSPGVWSVAMVFFQGALLAGYGYAHIMTKHFSLKTAGIVHVIVLLTAFVFLPLAVPAGWDNPPEAGQSIWLLGLLSVSIGLPFFAVAANSPLLQAWFARTGHEHAADPYFLYGASNIGSFASLILYIVLFEPTMALPSQTMTWAVGFGVLTALIGMCIVMTVLRSGAVEQVETSKLETVEEGSWKRPMQWVALAFIPSGLLVAVTAHISTDIASAPFLWVLPLALFLLTFVLAFARKPFFKIETLSLIVLVSAVAVLMQSLMFKSLSPSITLPLHLGFFFFAALLAHSFLVQLRPQASDLTSFYLWMSFGGVLGGAITTLVAPLVFTMVIEYPVLVLGALLCRPALFTKEEFEKSPLPIPLQPALLVVVMVLLAVTQSIKAANSSLFIERSFFGVTRVFNADNSNLRVMKHGSTFHGVMRHDEEGSKPTPLAYYYKTGGIARSLFAAQEKIGGRSAQMGVIGLGAGSILCHRQPGETWTSYEIDRAVVNAASDPKLFRFVPECGNGDPIIIGDGRLQIAKEPANKFDYLLIDAFSSDSIPVHLLTVEAVDLYRSKLAKDGILALHISNRYLELESALAAIADELGLVGRSGFFRPDGDFVKTGAAATHVVVLANSEEALGSLQKNPDWNVLKPSGTQAWTDNYSNVPAAMLRRKSKSKSKS